MKLIKWKMLSALKRITDVFIKIEYLFKTFVMYKTKTCLDNQSKI
ncbi:hypothetical protein [Helcococcus bovis]